MTNWKDIHPDFTAELQKEWEERGLDYEQCKEWLGVGLTINDADYAYWLKDEKFSSIWFLNFSNKEILRKKYEDDSKTSNHLIIDFLLQLILEESKKKSLERSPVQKWLDKNYPMKEREWVSEIYLNKPDLEGRLDLSGFNWHDYSDDGIKLYVSYTVDENKLKIEGESVEIIKLVKAQEWIDREYNTKESKKEIIKLDIEGKGLEGNLDLSEFINLEELKCGFNKLTSLEVGDCQKLKLINCGNNNLTKLDLINLDQLRETNCCYNEIDTLNISECNNLEKIDCSHNHLINFNFLLTGCDLEKLKQLLLSSNKFAESDLTPFSKFVNLENLDISDNSFTGSLKPLQNLLKLGYLHISNTNIDSGLEYLSDNIKNFSCQNSGWEKKSRKIEEELKPFWRSGVKDWKKHWRGKWMENGLDNYEFEQWTKAGLEAHEYELTRFLKQKGYQPTALDIKEAINKECWQHIHPSFNYELRKEWEKKGFNFEQTREWINVGAEPGDRKFIKWLIDIKNKNSEWFLNDKEEFKKLRERHKTYGLCQDCQQINTRKLSFSWCQSCNAKRLQKNFSQWTSGNLEIDKFIQECQLKEADDSFRVLEWIPYENFTRIEHIADGGFSKVYRAWWEGPIRNWNSKEDKWERPHETVILKSLNNSKNISTELLQEIIYHRLFDAGEFIVPCYGISQDPETKNYIIVMQYGGNSLRRNLKGKSNNLNFSDGLCQLKGIAQSLNSIHEKKLIHRDLHTGNILRYMDGFRGDDFIYITDLGLCRPVNETNQKKVYGILSYIAPEVLRGQPYTQAADIYSFGIVAYEIMTGLPPYATYDEKESSHRELPHDISLALAICSGFRPNLNSVKVPQLLKDLISKCWDADPKKRPAVSELRKILWSWWIEVESDLYEEDLTDEIIDDKKIYSEFYYQYDEMRKEVKKMEKKKFKKLLLETYSQYTGKNEEIEGELVIKIKLFSEFCKKHKFEKKSEELTKEFNKLISVLSEEARTFSYQVHSQNIYTSSLLDFQNLPEPQNSKEINEVFYKISEELEDLRISDTVKFSKELKKRLQEQENPLKSTEINESWQSLHSTFTSQLTQSWQSLNFTAQQCKEWLDIGLQPTDHNFASWLRDTKHLTPEAVLNHGNYQALNQEFFTEWQTQIEIPPKN